MIGTRLTVVAALAVGFLAMPGLSKSDPVVLDGTSWLVTGRAKVKVNKLGADWDDEVVKLDFGGGATWSSEDDEFNNASGTYTTKGKKANKLDATLDPGSVAATEAWLAAWVVEGLADEGIVSGATVDLTSAKIKGNVIRKGAAIKIRILYKFTATATDLGESSKGQYKVTLRGSPAVQE